MLNEFTIIGYVGRDPEVRRLETGVAVARFNVATTENYKDKDGEKCQKTEWHKVVAYRSLAEIAERYVKKGSFVLVKGKIEYQEYTDSQGIKRIVTNLVASVIKVLDRVQKHDDEE